MKTIKSLFVLGAVLTAPVNVQATTTFIYTFSFVEDRSWPATTIVYSGTQLPVSGGVLNLDHTFGNVNGCAPSLIQASFQSSTNVFFGPVGGESPACTGTASGVVGFAFNVENAFQLGIFDTMGAGRIVKNATGGLDYYYAGGSVSIREGVTPSPVPEPNSIILAGLPLLLIPFTRKLVRH